MNYSYFQDSKTMCYTLIETNLAKSRIMGTVFNLEDVEMIVEALNCRHPVEATEASAKDQGTSESSSVEPTVAQYPSRYMNSQCGNFFGHLDDHSNTRHRWINSEYEHSL